VPPGPPLLLMRAPKALAGLSPWRLSDQVQRDTGAVNLGSLFIDQASASSFLTLLRWSLRPSRGCGPVAGWLASSVIFFLIGLR
jgi:hypothetical protein